MGGLTDVKKNGPVEEWNGRREITEKSFTVGNHVMTLLATIVGRRVVMAFLGGRREVASKFAPNPNRSTSTREAIHHAVKNQHTTPHNTHAVAVFLGGRAV